MLLPNGLQTIEVGSTAWRIILNHLITNIYTQQEIDNMVENAVEPELIFVSNLPTSGDITKLYIVTSTNLMYRWNAWLNAFVSVGGGSSGGSSTDESSISGSSISGSHGWLLNQGVW